MRTPTNIFKSLEEKFLFDFAQMEIENEGLKARVAQLEAERANPKSGYANRTLDAKCRALGRQDMYNRLFSTNSTVKGRDFDEYARDALNKWSTTLKEVGELGVSEDAVIDYFDDELSADWERACNMDAGEVAE